MTTTTIIIAIVVVWAIGSAIAVGIVLGNGNRTDDE